MREFFLSPRTGRKKMMTIVKSSLSYGGMGN